MTKWAGKFVSAVLLAVCTAGCAVAVVSADTLQSPNYKFDESVLGAGGLVQSNSASYQSGLSIGDTAIGNSASTNYQTEAGSMTTSDPTLSVDIISSAANFGSFSPTAAATATSSFSVANYTSYGYAVQIMGNPPHYGSHTIPAMGSTGPSQIGIEQFGINLVANTAPANFGANADHGQFGIGAATANYATPNQYRYVNGETIVTGPKSSGKTIYTISYIVNVSSLTPGGQYDGNQTVVVTGTF